MKKLRALLTVLSILFVLGACSDSRPDDLPVSRSGSASGSFRLLATAGSSIKPDPVSLRINDFTAIEDYVKWVNKADVQATSFIEIKGIGAGADVELREVTLTSGRDSRTSLSLGTLTANERIVASNVTRLTFLQKIMDEIVRHGSTTVELTCTTTHDITTPITISVNLNTNFSFN